MSEHGNLLIVGASARAAAQSAQRAGFAVTAIDLFGDEDLAACARVIRWEEYPRGLARLAEKAADGPWMYTGGLENHPRVVARIAARRPLWGNTPDVLRAVRNPLEVHAALERAGLPVLEVRRDAADLPRDGTWLAKPSAGCGGGRIRVLAADAKECCYFQRRKLGTPASAVFLAAQGQAVLLGASEQIVGEEWTGGKEFQYAGSVGPLELDGRPLDARIRGEIERLGNVLAERFRLAGSFGVDGIIDGGNVDGGRFWPVEVNPRYTASCEVIERLTGTNAVAAHVAACRRGELNVSPRSVARSGAVGKAIVFATADGVFDERAAAWVDRLNVASPHRQAADIPRVGTRFLPGQPVLTVLADGDRPSEIREWLMRLASGLRDQLA